MVAEITGEFYLIVSQHRHSKLWPSTLKLYCSRKNPESILILLLNLLSFRCQKGIVETELQALVFWSGVIGGGWLRQRCRVSYVIGASNRDWLSWTRPAILAAGKGREGMFFFSSVPSLSFIFLLLPCPSLLSSLLPLFSLFQGDDTK